MTSKQIKVNSKVSELVKTRRRTKKSGLLQRDADEETKEAHDYEGRQDAKNRMKGIMSCMQASE